MIHPATELRLVDPAIGHGVYATAAIPRGTLVWVRDRLDRVLSPAEIAALPPLLAGQTERHFWLDRSGDYVLAWDLARFVNHSCRPNCAGVAPGVEIAITDIAPGEQITNDYAELGMRPDETLTCACGAPTCRGLVSGAEAEAIRTAYGAAARDALGQAPTVQQPLAALLSIALRRRLLEPPQQRPRAARDWRIRNAASAVAVRLPAR